MSSAPSLHKQVIMWGVQADGMFAHWVFTAPAEPVIARGREREGTKGRRGVRVGWLGPGSLG